jgi:hypothetical protein
MELECLFPCAQNLVTDTKIISSSPSYPISFVCILILAFLLRLCARSGLFPSAFLADVLCAFRFSAERDAFLIHQPTLNLSIY